jgi:hypothetical protein
VNSKQTKVPKILKAQESTSRGEKTDDTSQLKIQINDQNSKIHIISNVIVMTEQTGNSRNRRIMKLSDAPMKNA